MKRLTIAVILATLAWTSTICAQDSMYTIAGHIVNQRGESIEYVNIGIPGTEVSTVSSEDGRFSITIPASMTQPLEFHHVSYQTEYLPAEAFASCVEDLTIRMTDAQLKQAVVYSGIFKEKTIVHKGLRIAGGVGVVQSHRTGMELGSVFKLKRPFKPGKLTFTVLSNNIPGCKISVNLYRIEDGDFINSFSTPHYLSVKETNAAETYTVDIDEDVLLGPGRYFIGLELIDGTPGEGAELHFPLYFAQSHTRERALGEFSSLPVNIGIEVSGMEYRQK